MTDEARIIHVAWGVSRAESVREALRMQGCSARVVALPDLLSLGPIASLDGDERRAWFEAHTRSDDEPVIASGDPETPWRDATAVGTYPVYWVCRTDAGEHACFLEFVSRMAGRPFDIVEANGLTTTGVSPVGPTWSLGRLRPEEIVASRLSERRRPFSSDESQAAMTAWSRLRRENAPLRVVRDGRLVSAPLTQFDAVLTQLAAPERERLIALIARTLRHLEAGLDQPGQAPSYELLFARVLALGDAGVLEVTGPGPGMRDYQVRHPAT